MQELIAVDRLSDRGSSYLDLLRGLSALAVMLGHLRGLFFVPSGAVQAATPFVKISYFLTSIGHEAVIVFFVLSGYFISASVLRSVAEGSWGWRSYLTRRLTRLYIVLIPALVIGGLVDLAGITLFHAVGPYRGDASYSHIIPYVVGERLDISIFLANAAYLEEILFPTFGSNGALWSLSYEFWFYLMFPCAVLALTKASRLSRRLLYGGLFLTMSTFVGLTIFSYFFIWLLGAAAALAPPFEARRGARIAAQGGALALCLGMLLLLRHIAMPAPAADALLALAILTLVHGLANGTEGPAKGLSYRLGLSRISHGIAGFSYTLYLVHLPLLVFLHAAVIWSGGARWQPDLAHGVVGIGIAILVVSYAWFLSRLTEAHTRKVTGYLLMVAQGKKFETANSSS